MTEKKPSDTSAKPNKDGQEMSMRRKQQNKEKVRRRRRAPQQPLNTSSSKSSELEPKQRSEQTHAEEKMLQKQTSANDEKSQKPGAKKAKIEDLLKTGGDQIDENKEFMGFPLAGGPNDDVSRLLSRDLF